MDNIELRQIAIAGSIIFLTLVGVIYTGTNPKAKVPPGPRGLSILGNALQVPSQHLAVYFRSLLEVYGQLVSLNLAGTRVLLIGDIKLANEILQKRAIKYSARPKVYYIDNYIDPDESYWAFHNETPAFHVGRKLTAGVMSSVRAGLTEPLQSCESLRSIQSLLRDGGKNWLGHISEVPLNTTFAAAFGVEYDSPELKEAKMAVEELVQLITPTASVINTFPFLDWIPGPMPWRTRARAYHKHQTELYDKLISEALCGKGSGMNTWTAEFVRHDKLDGDQRRFMNQFAAAAIETVAGTLQIFVLACVMHPEWMRKAQKQIDDIVGSDRLPSFADRSHLPYIEAVVRETLRWRPVGRFGVPHESTADDVIEYNGEQYFIRAGTVIFAVCWAIEHDPTRYTNPDSFNPERFLDDKGQLRSDYETSTFGFGRRVCPGIPFAERTLWIQVAMLLWTFNIRKAEGTNPETGLAFHYDDGDAGFTGDFANVPHKFPAVFEPRSAQHAEVARREWEECEKDLNALLPAAKE